MIDDVIAGVRDSFLDEGVDEQVLQEMKQVWTSKLMASKAVEVQNENSDIQPPPIIANNTPKSKVKLFIIMIKKKTIIFYKFVLIVRLFINSLMERNQRNRVHNENTKIQIQMLGHLHWQSHQRKII